MNTNLDELRARCAAELLAGEARAASLAAFVGLDGFVDEILHVVDKRQDAQNYTRLSTIGGLAERIAGAAGKSSNLELVTQIVKLGGNGPIMANALASFGVKVTYLGLLGYPSLHPVFQELAARAEVHSIANPGTTDALEFVDGKIMLGKHASLKEMSWENILARYGRDAFAAKFNGSDLVAFVNWTMLPGMSQIWESILSEVCSSPNAPRRLIFFDLADPEKRTAADIRLALDLITRFQSHFDVILGLNQKEALEIAEVCGIAKPDSTPESLGCAAREIAAKLNIATLLVHPVAFALAVSAGRLSLVNGPYEPRPKVTTGAGDHLNSGFCLGKMLGLDDELSLLAGVATSGYYVRTGQSPSIAQLAGMLRQGW